MPESESKSKSKPVVRKGEAVRAATPAAPAPTPTPTPAPAPAPAPTPTQAVPKKVVVKGKPFAIIHINFYEEGPMDVDITGSKPLSPGKLKRALPKVYKMLRAYRVKAAEAAKQAEA